MFGDENIIELKVDDSNIKRAGWHLPSSIFYIDYVNANYGVTLQYEQMQCGFTDFNEQCIKERCPFYE